MEPTLFKFIWKYSWREQFVLLAVTLITFPLLYATLELPKRIINDAIGSTTSTVDVFGYTLTQFEFLMLLCFGFITAVLVHGLTKMRLNTMKGVLAERLLRRFRFQMLSRMHKFPRSYFRKTSQGEIVAMVTSEAEPMGGLMGDALSQPVFQAGQMITILSFLFAQSLWFGLASVALIPLQAWLIPRLQRQINLLNKARIKEVRHLASDIGESVDGVSDLRINGGLRYRMAQFSDRLGRLYKIRFDIYQKKFFMKFLNNFINQLTPFFFYSVGGYLAIQGQISVGALVAALAAYKDLSSPWKELLFYYNQTQDMSLRWQVVMEKFDLPTVVDEKLFDGTPDSVPRLVGDIELKDITVRDEDDNIILDRLNLTIPQGARVAVKTSSPITGTALADLLTREVIPSRGSVTIAGHPLNELHQTVVAGRIGYAHSHPYLFAGTLGENLYMPFRQHPEIGRDPARDIVQFQREARATGNSPDPVHTNWVAPEVGGFHETENISEWWFELVQAMGADDFMVRRTLRSVIDPGTNPELEQKIVELRPEIARQISQAGLDDIVFRFDPDKFNPVSPLGVNLLYALPPRRLSQEELADDGNFLRLMREEEIADEAARVAASLVLGLNATFGRDGTDHPLFRALNLDEDLYFELVRIAQKRRDLGEHNLNDKELSLLLSVTFAFSAEQIGPVFKDEFKDLVLEVRRKSSARLIKQMPGHFEPITEDRYLPIMSVQGNAIFGRISDMAGARAEEVENIVVDVLTEHGLRLLAAHSIYDLRTVPGAENLPPVFRERAAFSRAAVKRPDILILENALASQNAEKRAVMRQRLGELLPNAIKIFIEKDFHNPAHYDLFIELTDGRIDGITRADLPAEAPEPSDLEQKLRAIAGTELFAGLRRKHQRLLAFSAQWFNVDKGQVIFSKDQPADAAYLCISGGAALYWPDGASPDVPLTEVGPGRLVGDLSVIRGEPRTLNLVATQPSVFLRIGARELRSVIHTDAEVAASLLKTVSGHLSKTSDFLRHTPYTEEDIRALDTEDKL